MPISMTRYTVLLSSPNDAEEEMHAAEDVLASINRTHGLTTGIEFYPIDWRRDSRAGSGDEPQALLNKQIVEDCDVALAIFKERFGTPTEEYSSGTEEEINFVLTNGGQALVYFWQPEDGFVPADKEQFDKVQAFKETHGTSAIYKTFSDINELRHLILHDFTKLIFELEGGKISAKPLLSIAFSDIAGKLMKENPRLQPSPITQRLNTEYFDELIRESFEKVIAIQLPEPVRRVEKAEDDHLLVKVPAPDSFAETAMRMQAITAGFAFASEPVEIESEEQKIVLGELGLLGISTPDNLFRLGKLSSNKQLAAINYFSGGNNLVGSADEKQKYEQLKVLVADCKGRRDLRLFLKAHASASAVCPVLRNAGGSPARHVLVELSFSDVRYIDKTNVPIPTSFFIGHLLDQGNALSKFANWICTPDESPEYLPYHASTVISESGVCSAPVHINQIVDPFGGRKKMDESDFMDEFDYLYGEYSLVKDAARSNTIIRVSFDRIQQGTACAFPTFLFFKGIERLVVHYRITADEVDKPIEGDIALSAENQAPEME